MSLLNTRTINRAREYLQATSQPQAPGSSGAGLQKPVPLLTAVQFGIVPGTALAGSGSGGLH